MLIELSQTPFVTSNRKLSILDTKSQNSHHFRRVISALTLYLFIMTNFFLTEYTVISVNFLKMLLFCNKIRSSINFDGCPLSKYNEIFCLFQEVNTYPSIPPKYSSDMLFECVWMGKSRSSQMKTFKWKQIGDDKLNCVD